MMSTFNQVNLLGNLGKDPEVLKTTEQGYFVRLSLATHRKYTTKEGTVQKSTQWHTVYLNNKLGKIAFDFLKKGRKVFISGELRTDKWQDHKTGETHYSAAVYAKEMRLLAPSAPGQEVAKDGQAVTDKDVAAYNKARLTMQKALGCLPHGPDVV